MERITYKITDVLAGERLVKESLTMVGDDGTIELAIDFTDTDYEAWEKRCDLLMADGTTDILGVDQVVTDIIAVWTLTSAHTKKGALVINPYCQLNGARKGFPKKSVTIESQLTNDTATASVRVIIEDYIDDLLTVKSVSATTLDPSEEATATVTIESDGTSFAFGIPQGIQGIQGLKGNQWQGEYSGATAYVVDDVVSYQGSAYICILASTNNLPTNTTYWQLFATTGTAIASNVTNTPAGGISATDVQTAINELDTEKANKTQEAWITPTLVNSWVRFNTTLNTAQYYKDSLGIVHLRGIIKSGVSGLICILPDGYRPSATSYFATVSNALFGYLTISEAGAVTAIVYDNAWISLENITFRAEL